MRIAALSTLLVVLGSASASDLRAGECDWPEFRGPTGQGLSSASSLPLEWSPDRNVAWKVAIPGKGWSSPIVCGGKIFLTTAQPAEGNRDEQGSQSLRALRLDATSGALEWNVEVFRHPGMRIHTKNSHASPTPLFDGERVYVHYGTHGTAALDLDGRILWTNRELRYEPVHGSGGSPALAGRAIVLLCDGADRQFVAALDRATGKTLWRKDRPWKPSKGFSFSTPLLIDVGGRKELVSPGSEGVVAYDPENGDEIWRVRYEGGYSVVPRPVYGQGLVFVCTGYEDPALLAIRPGGRGDVTETHVAWRRDRGVPHNPSPLLVGDRLTIVSDRGIATCLDARTGKEHWQRRLGGSMSASPLAAAGRIYFLSEEGEAIVLGAEGRGEELARNDLGERTLASPAVAGSAIFIRTEKHLFRIEESKKSGG
jgi:outer membrane protein assembly factor BamB